MLFLQSCGMVNATNVPGPCLNVADALQELTSVQQVAVRATMCSA